MADCFNDKRVSSGVWRPRDTNQEGEVSDLIRDTNDPFRKAHLIAPRRLTNNIQISLLSIISTKADDF